MGRHAVGRDGADAEGAAKTMKRRRMHDAWCPACEHIVRVCDKGFSFELKCPVCRTETIGLKEALQGKVELIEAMRGERGAKEGRPLRPETGPIKFGDDWTGVFLRGDDALHFSVAIEKALKTIGIHMDVMMRMTLNDLVAVLRACTEGPGVSQASIQELKAWQKCQRG